MQILICRNEAEKCLIESSINSLRISIKVTAMFFECSLNIPVAITSNIEFACNSVCCFWRNLHIFIPSENLQFPSSGSVCL